MLKMDTTCYISSLDSNRDKKRAEETSERAAKARRQDCQRGRHTELFEESIILLFGMSLYVSTLSEDGKVIFRFCLLNSALHLTADCNAQKKVVCFG